MQTAWSEYEKEKYSSFSRNGAVNHLPDDQRLLVITGTKKSRLFL